VAPGPPQRFYNCVVLIGFVGDLHGRVLYGLVVVLEWQRRHGRWFDLIVQVGDLGEPNPDPNGPDAQIDPAEFDFSRLLTATGRRAVNLRRARALLPGPIRFVRGNHEDFAWLRGLGHGGAADPFDLFSYVRDATVDERDGLRIAFLGGVEEEGGDPSIDRAAYERLLSLGPGRVDLLVSHEGPYGSSIGFHGDVHGSPAISRLIERLEPRWQVAGHAHVLHGPRAFDRTTYLGLDGVVASPRWHPEKTGFQPGCLAVLDTDAGTLEPVQDDWLEQFDRRQLDFDAFIEAL
jgi:hypothetical protein